MGKSKISYIAKILFLLSFILIFSEVKSQSHLLFGDWKAYLPYHSSSKVSETKNKIFCSNNTSLFSIDKDDFSIEFYDKVTHLNDVDIINHKYDPFNNQLVIAYRNGNIDILNDDDTYLIPDIKNNISLLGQKEINDICVANENFAYLSFNFGVTQFNLKNYEFGFTCFTDFDVNNVIQKGSILYMGSENGIYTIDLSKDNNASDILQWSKISNIECDNLVLFNSSVYFLSNLNIYKILDDNSTETIYNNKEPEFETVFLNASEDYLILGKLNFSDDKSKIVFVGKDHKIIERFACAAILKDALIDSKGKVWYADTYKNVRWTEGIEGDCNLININSPLAEENYDIETFGNKIFVASGGANKLNFDYEPTHNGFYIFNDNEWENYSRHSSSFIRDSAMENFVTIAPSKINDKVYIGTNYSGVLELDMKDGSMKLFNKETTNKKIDGAQGHYVRERVIDMQFDSDNNLWMSNFRALKPLVVFTKERQFYNFKLGGEYLIGQMEIDNNDNIWIKVVNNGVIVYNFNETIKDPTDDVFVTLNSSNTNLPSNTVNAIKTDLDGNVWVGTDQGPVVFECAGSVFNHECSGSRKKTVLEGIPAYVLDNVNITAIEVDGANRKWIGSTSGLYVLSSSGENELMHFTVNNSPLFDDNISALAYNGESGEMIIGTDKGILSFKTETLEGNSRNDIYAYAFPNPVSPDYRGPIAIKGLARDANIKIVDINGLLVYETKANGGQAIWHGEDLKGNRVGSGVYTVISTGSGSGLFNSDQPEAIAIKIFFIK